MTRFRSHVWILAAMLILPSFAHAQAMKHVPTLDESLSLKSVNSPMISPDGRFVTYRMNETNWKDNEFISQIWLVNLATGANFQLTRGKHGPGAAEWSPDGKWLAFVAERDRAARGGKKGREERKGREEGGRKRR